MNNGTEVGAKTRIVFTPGQLAALLSLIIGAALWMNNMAQKVETLNDRVGQIQATQSSMVGRLDRMDPRHSERRRTAEKD